MLYRNSYSSVIKFLNERHNGHYRIYNLLLKRGDRDIENIRYYGFHDHNACPLEKLCALSEDIHSWITRDPNNIAAIHCKAGKGRTGLAIAAYLLRNGTFKTARESL